MSASPAPLLLMGLGHPLLDISSRVDMEYLERFNVALGSVNLAEPSQLPIFEDLSQRRDVEFVPGGAAMNAVRVARWVSGGTLPVYFVGSLGDDEFGGILERTLNRAGVVSVFEYHDDKPTGTCACLIADGGERSLLANLGAAVDFSMDHMRSAAVSKAIESVGIFYCEGFFLNTVSSPDNANLIGDHCVAQNKCFAFNLSAPYLCHIFKSRWVELMPLIDIIFGSRIDAEAFAEALEWGTTDIKEVMRRIADMPKRNANRRRLVVITNGSAATFVATSDSVQSFTPLNVPPEEIVDTNGAGDSFVGGFLSQYALGEAIERCVQVGHIAAAEVIRHNGCTFPEAPPKI